MLKLWNIKLSSPHGLIGFPTLFVSVCCSVCMANELCMKGNSYQVLIFRILHTWAWDTYESFDGVNF